MIWKKLQSLKPTPLPASQLLRLVVHPTLLGCMILYRESYIVTCIVILSLLLNYVIDNMASYYRAPVRSHLYTSLRVQPLTFTTEAPHLISTILSG